MKNWILALGMVLLVGVPQAQAADIGFGVQGSFGSDSDFGVGARVIVDLAEREAGLAAIASFDYFFPGDGGTGLFALGVDLTYWELNGNLVYNLSGASEVGPYIGAGVNFAHVSASVAGFGSASDSEVGLNLLGGLNFGAGSTKLFAEAKLELGGGEQFVANVGIRF